MKESNQMLKIKQYTHQFTPLYEKGLDFVK